MHRKREFLLASLVSLLIFSGTLFNIPPFKTVMDFGAYLSGIWGLSKVFVPFLHTARLTLNELSGRIPLFFAEVALSKLRRAGIVVENAAQSLA